jgi:hypothetical protein
MRPQQALGERFGVVAVTPGRVRVALLVAVLVVPPVVGHPGDDRALHRQAARDRQRDPQAGLGLERAVGEVPVVANRDAKPGDPVEDRRDHDVVPVQPPAPGERDGGDERQHRHEDEDADQELRRKGHLLF